MSRLREPAASGSRRWAAIGAATAAFTVSFWLVIFAFDRWLGGKIGVYATTPEAMTTDVTLILAGAFGVMLAGTLTLAGISRHSRPWRATLTAALLVASIWLWLPFLVGEPVTPMAAAFGAAGIGALPEGEVPARGIRILTVLAMSAFMWLFFRVIPPGAMILAPLLPLQAVAWADNFAAPRAETK